MDEKSAEMTKYAANSFLATKISFMNEIANLCEKVGADVDKVRIGIGSDSRIGKRFLFPGVGYGGSCFPKDVQALHLTAIQNGYDFKILDSVMAVNKTQKFKAVEKLNTLFGSDLKGKKIGIWGLAFKPNTDDIREAPALYTIDSLLQQGAVITVYDPEAMDHFRELYGDKLTYCGNKYEAADGVDALVILTEWNVFRTPNFDKLSEIMNQKNIIDGRNLFTNEQMAELGFVYDSIGRPSDNQSA